MKTTKKKKITSVFPRRFRDWRPALIPPRRPEMTHAATFAAAADLLHSWQHRYEAADNRALAATVDSLARLAGRGDGGLQQALERLIHGMAELEATISTLTVEQRLQRSSLDLLLSACLGADDHLPAVLRGALVELARDGTPSGGEAALIPRVLCSAPEPVALLFAVKQIAQAIKERLECATEVGSRVAAVRMLHALWDSASGRLRDRPPVAAGAPECPLLADGGLGRLGAVLMNSAVDACLYDGTGKVRLAATRLLLALCASLPQDEVLKLALVKARDRDKETRKAAFRLIGLVLDGAEPEGTELPPRLRSIEAVETLVLQAGRRGRVAE